MSKAIEMFGDKTVLDYTREMKVEPYLGDTLFPAYPDKIQGSVYEFIKGANNAPVVAHVHAPNTEAEIASRDKAEKIVGDLSLIKRKVQLDEDDIIKMENFRNKAEERQVINKVFNDVDKMVEGCRARIEAMRMEALTTGKISVNENGIKTSIDFGIPTTHKVLTGIDWSVTETATPIEDISAWVDKIVDDTGVRPTRALTSNKVLSLLLKNASIRKAVFGVNSDRMLTKTELNTFLASQELPVIATYDKVYREQGKDGKYSTKRYFNEDMFVLLPPYELGETVYGVTAEEIRLSQKQDLDFEDFGNIIAYIKDTDDPVATWTFAVTRANISLPCANEIFIAKVK